MSANWDLERPKGLGPNNKEAIITTSNKSVIIHNSTRYIKETTYLSLLATNTILAAAADEYRADLKKMRVYYADLYRAAEDVKNLGIYGPLHEKLADTIDRSMRFLQEHKEIT